MTYEQTLHEARLEEERGERASEHRSEVTRAEEDVSVAAWNCGLLFDVLDESAKGKVARFLLEDAMKRNGAWPTPQVAHLQRDWDHLCRVDSEASRADVAACRDISAGDAADYANRETWPGES